MSQTLTTIIVAGGRGLRMGEEMPKQFLLLGNRPVLMHTIERLFSYDSAMSLVVVLPEDQFGYWGELCQQYHFDVSYELVAGGDSRFQSVKNGLGAVGDSDLVAIHDGVRPFVSQKTIHQCCEAASQNGAAIPVVEVVETLRKIDQGKSEIRPRGDYRLVQTPQVFQKSLILEAYEKAGRSDFTDDASVVEAAGHEITLVDGNRENIKLTSPFDLLVAEGLLKKTDDL